MNKMIKKPELATLAGGCFWTIEAIYSSIKGVINTTCGYTGGSIVNPTYEQVSTGTTGHVEAIQIRFDPKIVTYNQLLDIFWYAHNPTTRERQFPDFGSQYNSVIFYHDDEQEKISRSSKGIVENLGQSRERMTMEIVTQILPAGPFYPAEERHQGFCAKNPDSEYCMHVTKHKLNAIRKAFPQRMA